MRFFESEQQLGQWPQNIRESNSLAPSMYKTCRKNSNTKVYTDYRELYNFYYTTNCKHMQDSTPLFSVDSDVKCKTQATKIRNKK